MGMRVIGKRPRGRCSNLRRAAALVASLLLPMMTGCAALEGIPGGEDLTLGTSFSALPNIGYSFAAGQVYDRDPERTWSFELEGTHQPWDDEDLSDDGNPAAGDITQIQIGVKRTSDPLDWKHWTQRYGVGWFRARGEPNIVQEPGDYEVLYAGFGFETHLTESITMGPELSLMLALREKGSSFDFVPQFNWHITWGF